MCVRKMSVMKILLGKLLSIIDVLRANGKTHENFNYAMSLTRRGRPYDDGFSILPPPGHSRRWMSCRATAQGRVVALCHCQIGAGVTPINDVGWHYGINGSY